MKYFYGMLSVLGTILPYSQLLPWLNNYGFDLTQFFSEMTQSRMGAFAWWDVFISIIVVIGFIMYEGKRKGMSHLWIPTIATVTVGVSRSEEHTSELQSRFDLVCRLLLEKKKT